MIGSSAGRLALGVEVASWCVVGGDGVGDALVLLIEDCDVREECGILLVAL